MTKFNVTWKLYLLTKKKILSKQWFLAHKPSQIKAKALVTIDTKKLLNKSANSSMSTDKSKYKVRGTKMKIKRSIREMTSSYKLILSYNKRYKSWKIN